MARADLLVKLVKSGMANDKVLFRKTAEAEEFGATVFREYELRLPDSKMKGIISTTLKNWSSRIVQAG